MSRFLLYANLSPRNCEHLVKAFKFDAIDLISIGLSHLDDDQVVELAKQTSRVIITQDMDFGRLYYRYQRGQIGVIVLRLRNQSIDAVDTILNRFFNDPGTIAIDLERSLVVIDESRVRVQTEP